MPRLLRLLAAVSVPLFAFASGGNNQFQELLLQGQSYVASGNYKQATDALERATSLNPSDSNAYLWLARAYGHRAEAAFPLAAPRLALKARDGFEKAVSLDPRNWDAVDDLFEYYMEAPALLGGGVDKARQLVDRSLALEPSQAQRQLAHMLALGSYLAKHSRFQESDAQFRKAYQTAPDAPRVIYTHASSLIAANRNIEEARELLKRYLALNLAPSDPPRAEAEKLLRKASGS